MMLFWIPLLFIILWAFWRMARHGEVGMGAGCCGMTHNGHSAMQGTPPAGQADPSRWSASAWRAERSRPRNTTSSVAHSGSVRDPVPTAC
jgi:hypothetical protein